MKRLVATMLAVNAVIPTTATAQRPVPQAPVQRPLEQLPKPDFEVTVKGIDFHAAMAAWNKAKAQERAIGNSLPPYYIDFDEEARYQQFIRINPFYEYVPGWAEVKNAKFAAERRIEGAKESTKFAEEAYYSYREARVWFEDSYKGKNKGVMPDERTIQNFFREDISKKINDMALKVVQYRREHVRKIIEARGNLTPDLIEQLREYVLWARRAGLDLRNLENLKEIFGRDDWEKKIRGDGESLGLFLQFYRTNSAFKDLIDKFMEAEDPLKVVRFDVPEQIKKDGSELRPVYAAYEV